MRKVVGIIEHVVIEIYDRAIKDVEASEKTGEQIFKNAIYIKKRVPNSRDVYDQPLKSTDIERYDDLYEKFLAGKEVPMDGTPLEECSLIDAAEVETLKAKNIFTTQQLVNMPESGMHRLGHGFLTLKVKVAKWQEQGKKNEELEKRVTELESNPDITELQETIKQLQEQIVVLEANQKKKPGRKKAA